MCAAQAILLKLSQNENLQRQIRALKSNTRLASINLCKFVQLEKPAERGHGTEGSVYVVIALSQLNASTGLFAVFGKHEGDSEEKEMVPELDVGDAVVWTHSNHGRDDRGTDGVSLILTYR